MLLPSNLDSSPDPGGDPDLPPLLDGILPATVQALREIWTPLTLARGDVITHQGDDPKIAIVVEGLLTLRRESPNGRRYTLALIGPGHVVGLWSSWRHTQARFDLVALSSARVLLLPGPEVQRLAEQDIGLALALLEVAVGALGLAYERLDEATFDTARRRLATIMLAYGDILTGVRTQVTRTELAGLIGTSREMLGQVLRDLESRAVMARRGGRLVILDRPELKRLGGWTDDGAGRRRRLRALID